MKNRTETLRSIESRYLALAKAERSLNGDQCNKRFNKLASIYSLAYNRLGEIEGRLPKKPIASIHENFGTFSFQ